MIPHSYAADPTPPPPTTTIPPLSNTPITIPTPNVQQVAQAVSGVEDVLPPNVLKVAVPLILVFLGLSYLMAVGTVCYRLIYVTVHLDGSAAGVSLAGPDLSTLQTVMWTATAVFCVVVVGTQIAAKLLSLFGK